MSKLNAKYEQKRKKQVVSAMKAIIQKIERGELKIETSGLYQNDYKWHFRIVLTENEVPVPAEQDQ